MTHVVILSGSPSASSRTRHLLHHVGERISGHGFVVNHLAVRDLPSDDLIFARATSPALAEPLRSIDAARGIVVGTPIYKAAYTGVLKTFLDLLPPRAFSGKLIFPLMTGGTPAHALALDYALRPVLMALGGPLVSSGLFVLDQHLCEGEKGGVVLEPDIDRQLNDHIGAFTRALHHHVPNG